MSGELSPLIKGRVDIDQYYKGMQTAENVVIVPQGGLKRRPGTQHVDTASKIQQPFVTSQMTITNANGGTAANINDFDSSTTFVTNGLGTTSGFVVASYDLSSQSSLGRFVEVKDIKLAAAGGGATTSTLTGSFEVVAGVESNFSTKTTVGTITVNKDIQSFKFKVPDSQNWKYFKISRVTSDSADLGSLVLSLTEFNILFETATASLAKTFDFSVESDRHYLSVLTGGFEVYKFTINSGNTSNIVGTNFIVNSATYRILSVVGSVARAEKISGTTTPPSSGTLAGTPTLTYSAVVRANSFGHIAFYRITDAVVTFFQPIAFLTAPFAHTEVQDVRDVQTENVMLMFHMEHFPKRIINTTDTEFQIDNIPFLNIPQFDFNDALSPTPTAAVQVMTLPNSGSGPIKIGDRFQIDVEGVLSKNITFAGDTTAAEQSSTIENIRKNLQDMPIFGDDGIVVERTAGFEYTITLDGNSSGTYELFSGFFTSGQGTDEIKFTQTAAGVPRSENVWSDTRGYPRTATFFQGRLWFGGSKSKRQSVFASRAGSFFDFFTEEGDDDEGIFITISSRNLTEIVDINPDRGLQIFTSGAEFLLTGNTPATVSIKAQTQHGSKFLEAKSLDGATLFIDKNGKTLRQYLYNYNEDAYNSVDISVLSSHLINNPADVGVLSGSTTEDANYVVIINQDGTAAILNTLRSQDINGFTKWTNGSTNTVYPLKLVSISTVNNSLFFVNERTTDTTTTYTIEMWNQDYLLDASVKQTDKNGISSNKCFIPSATTSTHLDGLTVNVVARGNVLPNRVVQTSEQGSFVALSDAEQTFILAQASVANVEIGFNFQPTVKSMPLNTTAGNIAGQNQMRDKKITRMNLRVLESAGVVIDGNTVPTLEFGTASSTPLNSDLSPFTGVIQDNNGGNGWSIEVVPEITVPNPMPFHIQAIEYEVQSS